MIQNNILPPDFDGVFRFTNWTDEDYTDRWNNVAYTFPAMKTVPLIVATETPEGTQHVRRKFAKGLAEREYFKSEKYKGMIGNEKNPTLMTGLTYNLDDLAPFIQKCLEPLPLARAALEVLPRNTEKNFAKDRKGKNVSKILDEDESLVGDGTVMED
jgi:hypothetical protein